jgi:hypothetical protein
MSDRIACRNDAECCWPHCTCPPAAPVECYGCTRGKPWVHHPDCTAAPVESPAQDAVAALRELVATWEGAPHGDDDAEGWSPQHREWDARFNRALAAARAVLQSLTKEG